MDLMKLRRFTASLPVIETERLILRKITRDDVYDMYSYSSLGDVTEYLLWSPHLNPDDTMGRIDYTIQRYRRGEYADWGICCRKDNRLIGTIGFADMQFDHNKAELGYVLSPEYQGKGYMKEALNAVIDLSFNSLDLHRLELRIMDGNEASRKLALACGFQFEGTARDSLIVKDKYRTIHHYALLSSDYMNGRGK